MKPYTRTIIGLFDGKRRYLIPLYQRRYSWKEDPQISLLWDDLLRAAGQIETDRSAVIPHFMGAIVISQIKTYGDQIQAFEVIDGQQRLTTFQLLLTALRDVAAEHGSRYAPEVEKYLLNDGVMETEENERYKLWPSITDRRTFVTLIDPKADAADLGELAEGNGLVGKLITLAYKGFRDRIAGHVTIDGIYQERRLKILFEALKEGLAVVSIELEGGDDPQTIFETLNSRGVQLTSADLLRNFIFQRAKGMGQTDGTLNVDRLYEKHWLPLESQLWRQETSRGRQTRANLDWMFIDHLAMNIGDIVSSEKLFSYYRKWILNKAPFVSLTEELEAISATSAVEQRLFIPKDSDPVGRFGQMANAFDVSTAMPLIVYLATKVADTNKLTDALAALESYIVRRDVCGLTTKNYNRFFVALINRLRECNADPTDELITYLSSRTSDLERWPDDVELQRNWIMREQYRVARQPRLRYIFEKIEHAKHTSLNENIAILSALTIEHIMPQKWQVAWPLSGMVGLTEQEYSPEVVSQVRARNGAVNTFGNLTLMTQSLNSAISNGAFAVKIPAIKANAALALNRELHDFDHWDESAIQIRGEALFEVARTIWAPPQRAAIAGAGRDSTSGWVAGFTSFPPDGTRCRFTYLKKKYEGEITDGALIVKGIEGKYKSFSAASDAVTRTSRNGWKDWSLNLSGDVWILADDWRRSLVI